MRYVLGIIIFIGMSMGCAYGHSVLKRYFGEVYDTLKGFQVVSSYKLNERTFYERGVRIRLKGYKKDVPLLYRLKKRLLSSGRGNLWFDLVDEDMGFLVIGRGKRVYEAGFFDEYETHYLELGKVVGGSEIEGGSVRLLPHSVLSKDVRLKRYFRCYVAVKNGLSVCAVYISRKDVSPDFVLEHYERQVQRSHQSTLPFFVGMEKEPVVIYTKRYRAGYYTRSVATYYKKRAFLVEGEPLVFRLLVPLLKAVLLIDTHRSR